MERGRAATSLLNIKSALIDSRLDDVQMQIYIFVSVYMSQTSIEFHRIKHQSIPMVLVNERARRVPCKTSLSPRSARVSKERLCTAIKKS